MLKRLFDIIFSLIGLTILFPLFVLIALRIKFDSKGPIFYRGVRVGRGGEPFKIYKFRTMVLEAEVSRPSSTPDDDLRITKVGKFLRRYKLDELPQLINVLKDEMSLVGPRPQVPWAVELYNQEEKAILNLKPGITDYASIRFPNEGEILRGSPDPDKEYLEKIHPEKTRLQLEYVRHASLAEDLKILAKTFKTLLLKSIKCINSQV
jgi:lipopolysaccharide/colanic/teichoic acid biosynthesis glycosyltransferase